MTEARTVDEAYSSACNTDDLTVKAERFPGTGECMDFSTKGAYQ